MRIVKNYEDRKNEIVETAERLFRTKGYETCTVNDILKEVAIAKGTFYHYFKSKKEVLDAVVAKYSALIISKAKEVQEAEDLSPTEKLVKVFLAMNISNDVGSDVMNEMHKAENALLHQKTLQEIVTRVAPILVKVIEEGEEKNLWSCKYPLEYMQILLTASIALMDEGIFALDENAQQKVLVALISTLEKMLSVPENSLL